jgi:transposase-like protein
MPKKKYTPDLKAKAVLEVLKERKTANEIAKLFQVHPTVLSTWKKQLLDGLPDFFADPARGQADRHQEQLLGRLYQQIGQLQVELDWLKKKSAQLG